MILRGHSVMPSYLKKDLVVFFFNSVPGEITQHVRLTSVSSTCQKYRIKASVYSRRGGFPECQGLRKPTPARVSLSGIACGLGKEMGNFLHMRSYKATDTFKLYLLYYSNPEYYIFTCFYLIEHVFEGIFTTSLVWFT